MFPSCWDLILGNLLFTNEMLNCKHFVEIWTKSMVNNLQDNYKPTLLPLSVELDRMDIDTFFKVVDDQKISEVLLKAATADSPCGN